MNVRVRLFAAAKHAAGRDHVDLELPDGATIDELRRQLAEELPAAADLVRRASFAVGTDYVGDKASVPPGTEVACIPPVSGG